MAMISSLNVLNFAITNPNSNFPKITFSVGKRNGSSSSSVRCDSAAISDSLTLDHGSVDGELEKARSKFGSKVRVNVPLKVYHVPRAPEIDLSGKVGVLKQYVGIYQGKRISANLPYKVEFVAEEFSGRDGKPLKILSHLREDEFEFLEF